LDKGKEVCRELFKEKGKGDQGNRGGKRSLIVNHRDKRKLLREGKRGDSSGRDGNYSVGKDWQRGQRHVQEKGVHSAAEGASYGRKRIGNRTRETTCSSTGGLDWI